MRNLFIKYTLLLTLTLITHTSFSQGRDSIPSFDIFERLSSKKQGEGEVKVIANSKLETVMKSRFNSSSKNLKGWRIRVYRDNKQDGRSNAERIRGHIAASYSNMRAYITYENPYWYVAVGDFYTRENAEKMKREMMSIYPGSSLIETTINFPKYE